MAKDKYIGYEVILAWSTPKRPFVTQKLGFKAPPIFAKAYREAKLIRDLLWKSGGLRKSAVKILSVSASGVLEEYQQEHAPHLLRKQAELKRQVQRFNRQDVIAKKASKAAFKAKPHKKLKDADFKFTIETQQTVKPKPRKAPKAIVQEKPEPLINAVRPDKKKGKYHAKIKTKKR